MDNGDATQGHAMTPQEFAKLMGAYPQPAENPLPTYGGYMDNSPANFSFVEFNDYFGSESEYDELIDLSNKAKERYMDVVEEWEIEDFCDNYDLDYDNSNDRQRAISKYLEQVPFDRIVEALDEDDQKRYYELTSGEREQMIHDAGYPEVFEAEKMGWEIKEYGNDDRYASKDGVEVIIAPIRKSSYQYHPRDAKWKLTYGRETPHGVVPLAKLFGTYGEVFRWLNNPPFEVKSFGAETFEAPYAGAGSLFGIKQDTGLEGFTTSELTTSSAIHGDFDEASLNYSGHQNFEVRAEFYRIDESTKKIFPNIEHWIDLKDPQLGQDDMTGALYDESFFVDIPTMKIYSVKFYFEDSGSQKAVEWAEENLGVVNNGIAHDKFNYDPSNPSGYLYYFGEDRKGNNIELFKLPYMGVKIEESNRNFQMAETVNGISAEDEMTAMQISIGCPSGSTKDFTRIFDVNVRGSDLEYLTSELEDEVKGRVASWNKTYDAEMEMIDESNARIKNRFGDEIGMVAVDDHEIEDAVVEVSDGSDMIQEVIISEAETKKSSMIPLALGAVAAIFAFPKVSEFLTKKELKEAETPELIENPNTGNLDPAQYEEMVVESTGYAVDVIPQVLDGGFMGSRFAALPTERYVEYNEGIGAHTDIALNRNEMYLEPEMAMVQASENVIKESQAPGQSPYNSMTGEENPDFDMRVIKETTTVSLDPAVKPFIPQSMSGYTGNANTPPSVMNKMFNIGVLGQTPSFVPGSGDIGANHLGSRNATPNTLGLNGSVGGPLSDQVNSNYTDGTTSMSLAQWSIENTVSQTSDTEAVVIDRSSGAMKRVRRV